MNQVVVHKVNEKPVGLTESSDKNQTISRLVVICLGLLLVISCVVVYYGEGIIAQVASLYPQEVPEHPYFQPTHTWLLYVLMPSVVISSLILLLLPGMFLVLAMGKIHRWTELMIWAFGISFIAYFFVTSAVKLISRTPSDSVTFVAAVASGGALAWAILAFRVFRGIKLSWPLATKSDVRRVCFSIAIPVVTLLALIPIIFWQDMHDDGFEALELGRSLSVHFLPRFPTATGFLGIGAGMIPMAYPVHWFAMLFGPVEASARLPMLLYLPVLFCLLVQLIEWRSPRALGFKEESLLCVAMAIYTVTMSYNASYDPYFADIAAPTAFETLTVVCILATIYFLWKNQAVWFFFFALLSYLCRPTGVLVLGLIGIAIVFYLPEQRRPRLIRISVAMGLCMLFAFVYDKIYIPSIVGDTDFGYPAGSILSRFRFLKLDDLSRINYILFPCGILPFISLLAFRWQDSLARVITIVSLFYFAFFYFQAFIALHHFVPVMLLPQVVFWRIYLHHQRWFRRLSLPGVALASVVAFWMSLPRHFEINRTVRPIGQRTAFLVGDYNTAYREQVRHAKLLFKLIPPDWEVKDPAKELVSGYCSIIYYSTRPKTPNTPINYVVQPLGNIAPHGFTKIVDDETVALYVRDLQQWNRDRFRHLRTDYRSVFYDIPRTTLFRHWGIPQMQYSIDLKRLIIGSWSSVRNKLFTKQD